MYIGYVIAAIISLFCPCEGVEDGKRQEDNDSGIGNRTVHNDQGDSRAGSSAEVVDGELTGLDGTWPGMGGGENGNSAVLRDQGSSHIGSAAGVVDGELTGVGKTGPGMGGGENGNGAATRDQGGSHAGPRAGVADGDLTGIDETGPEMGGGENVDGALPRDQGGSNTGSTAGEIDGEQTYMEETEVNRCRKTRPCDMSDGDQGHDANFYSEGQHGRSVRASSKEENFDRTDGHPTPRPRITYSEGQQRRSVITSSNLQDFEETDGQSTAHPKIVSFASNSEQEYVNIGCSEDQRRLMRTSYKQREFDNTDGHPIAHPTTTSHMSHSDKELDTTECKEAQHGMSLSTFTKQEDVNRTNPYPTSYSRKTTQKMNCSNINIGEKATLKVKGKVLAGALVDAGDSRSCRNMTSEVSKQYKDLAAKENVVNSPKCEENSISDSFEELSDASDGLPTRSSNLPSSNLPVIMSHYESVCENNKQDEPLSLQKASLQQKIPDKPAKDEKSDDKDVPSEGVAGAKQLAEQTNSEVKSVVSVAKDPPASFAGVQSKRTYLEQGARPKQAQTSYTHITPNSSPDVQSSQAFFKQGARQKQYRQPVAGLWEREIRGRNDSLLASSPENHGLDVAFLARHSQDCSISLHSYQASDNFYFSTPPLEENQNKIESRSKMQRHADHNQQYLTRSYQSISTGCTVEVVPEIPRNLLEVLNPGDVSTSSAQSQQISDPIQQLKGLCDHQSATPCQPDLFLHPSEVHPGEPPALSRDHLPCSGQIISKHNEFGWQPPADRPLANTSSGNQQVAHADTVGSSSVPPTHGDSKERLGNSVGDTSTDGTNEGKKGKNSLACEETNRAVGDRLIEDELETGELDNVSISGTESLQSVEETLTTLGARVAEACVMVERVFRERRARDQEAREREERVREEQERVFREQEEREREEEERAARAGQDGHTSAVTDNQEPGIDGERYPVQESPQWLCEHYQRRCKVRFPCCRGYHPCHR